MNDLRNSKRPQNFLGFFYSLRYLLRLRGCLKVLFIGSLVAAVLAMNSCAYFTKKYYTNPEMIYAKLGDSIVYDALIVPGFPHYKDSTTAVIYQRVNWAVYLFNKGIAKYIIFSGGAVHTPYVEAKIMALYAEKLGVPASQIFVEDQAEHSVENIYYGSRLGMSEGLKTFAVATDVVQSSFLYSINNHRFEMDVDFLPIVMDSLLKYIQPLPVIEADLARKAEFIALKDREGLFKRLGGTKGRPVKRMLKKERKAAKALLKED